MVALTLAASASALHLLFVSAVRCCMADCDWDSNVVHVCWEKPPEAGTTVNFWNLVLSCDLKSNHCMHMLELLWATSPFVSRLHVLYASASCQKQWTVSTVMTAFSPEVLCQTGHACCSSAAIGYASLAVCTAGLHETGSFFPFADAEGRRCLQGLPVKQQLCRTR
jgi:hypothetical protein